MKGEDDSLHWKESEFRTKKKEKASGKTGDVFFRWRLATAEEN
jgi:hypothetical protein